MAQRNMTRRSLIKTAAVGAGVALAEAKSKAAARKGVLKLKNSDFYDKDKKFQGDAANKAYFDMMKRFNYPIPEPLEKGLWAVDFGVGDFVNVGLGGIFWWNNKEYGFFGHEIFLLPGQMIVEHAHMKTPDGPAKMESWQVRHGMVYTLGEGEETKPMPIKLPQSQAKFITVKNCLPLKPGEVRGLNRLTAKHFMIAGPQGAIVTEYATYHDNAGLRFTNPDAKL